MLVNLANNTITRSKNLETKKIKVVVNPKFLPEEIFFQFFDGLGYRIYRSFALRT